MPDRPTCPRCGTARLIRRETLLAAPRLRDGLALCLRFRLLRPAGAIRRTHLICELCGHRWRVDEPAVEACR